jgi:excinuclease ABC subunit B
MSLSERKDVIIVASVSCIYGLGIPQDYRDALIRIKTGEVIERDELLKKLVNIHYGRNDIAFERGTFRVNGDIVDIYPAYLENSIRVEFFGDEIERISRINPLDNHVLEVVDEYPVYPANHFITTKASLERAIKAIQQELKDRIAYYEKEGKLLEAQRIEQRTNFDLEMLRELGFCSGIENYSRHLTGAKKGDPPFCLLDYFPEDYLMVIDESHASIPQIHAMYGGDYTRKKNLVDYGFRLPSAFDNRPLKFHEFENKINQIIYISATPGDHELSKTDGVFIEQVIRPTGLIDPEIEIKPVSSQVDNLLEQIRVRVTKGDKILVTTLTKRMAEDLSEYLKKAGVKSKYMHSEINTIERSKIIRELRLGEFDVLVGINLLREGLDLPEVSLVAILDADKAGFLRSTRSLIQTAGRAARHIDGMVIFYADNITSAMQETISETNRRRTKQLLYNKENKITPESIKAMQETISETNRRRTKQLLYNKENKITPESIKKNIDDIMTSTSVADGYDKAGRKEGLPNKAKFMEYLELDSKEKVIELLEKEMMEAAGSLNFERAAELRDRIFELKES